MNQSDRPFIGSDPPDAAVSSRMTADERRASLALAGIFTLRMLGLFMILPVFSLYADDYAGHTPMLIGLAIGIYGLTQALFQIPFGMLSDRIGRKRVIVGGLLIFVLGSAVAAMADTITGVILGRALQGLGAIAAAVMALTADLTREEQRTKAMAIIGVCIGLAFALAMVIGPVVTRLVGLSGLFWLTGVLALLGIAVLVFYVPNPRVSRFHRDTEPVPAQFARIVGDGQLLRLDIGILILHLIMTASFVVLPLALRDEAGLPAAEHWKVYLLVLTVSVLIMVPFVVYADRYNRLKQVFIIAIALLVGSQAGLSAFHQSVTHIVVLLVVYFSAFNILEASLPSLVSRIAPPEMKGTALGAYSTCQYFGAFLGGLCGGWIYGLEGGLGGVGAVFAFCATLAGIWLLVSAAMHNRRRSAAISSILAISLAAPRRSSRRPSSRVTGVAEAVVIEEEGIAYLKVDRKRLDRDALRAFSVARP